MARSLRREAMECRGAERLWRMEKQREAREAQLLERRREQRKQRELSSETLWPSLRQKLSEAKLSETILKTSLFFNYYFILLYFILFYFISFDCTWPLKILLEWLSGVSLRNISKLFRAISELAFGRLQLKRS